MIGPAGRRRCFIEIQSLDTTPITTDGATPDTPRHVVRVFGRIIPKGGQERYLANGQQDTSTHELRIPYVAGLTPKMRGVYAGRTFNFTNINNADEENRELVISATELL